MDEPGERDYYSTCPNWSTKIFETGLETQIICTCCGFIFKSNANSVLLIQNGEIEQRYLNKQEQERLKMRIKSAKKSMPSNLQHYNGSDEENDKEEEEEEEEDDDDEDGHRRDEELYNFEEEKESWGDFGGRGRQSKELRTVTLLVIEETLIDDFVIKDNKDNEIKSIEHSSPKKEDGQDTSPSKYPKVDNVKNNLQGEENPASEGLNDEYKGKPNKFFYFTNSKNLFRRFRRRGGRRWGIWRREKIRKWRKWTRRRNWRKSMQKII